LRIGNKTPLKRYNIKFLKYEIVYKYGKDDEKIKEETQI
jgi:hypothetical protein